ncbi:RNA polymerase sigma factor [Enterococcus faecalis]|uniref:Sigma-70 region 2 n=1 Tax=Enterococcus faecalis RP2S-4 TaxID=1244145 RepID=A0ABC9TMX0_ENTFL|nr:RNA polymerase sigma factor [Enterococcus faecalis]EPI11335.1 Sigma-70 region 2 [Enterococcus faecalis RP2S-4]
MEKELQIELVQKSKAGDVNAFIKLCEAYQTILYNSAYKILLNYEDAGDCLQETEFKAWQKIETLTNEAAFNTWIFKIMTNISKNMLVKKQNFVELEENTVTTFYSEKANFFIKELLSEIPDIYRISLILYYYAGFSAIEIAQQQRISVNTVKTRIARGREILKKRLEEKKYG